MHLLLRQMRIYILQNNQSSHVYYIYNKCHKNVCINNILIHAYSINTKSSHIFILPPSKKYLHLQACHIFKKDKMNNLQVKKPQKSTISNIVSRSPLYDENNSRK